MNNLLILALNLILFLLIFAGSFYPFGFFVIEKLRLKLTPLEKLVISFLCSLSIFVLLSMLLGLINLRFLTVPLVLTANVYSIFNLKTKLFVPWKDFFTNKSLLLMVVVAIVVQGAINFPSGYMNNGLRFWSSQGNDGLWHVALMEEIKKSMPPGNPIYAGVKLYNYHYLSDVLMGEFGRIYPFFLTLDLYFRFFPIVFSFFISMSVFTLVRRWQASNTAGYWAIFFTSLSGSFGYIVTYIKSGNLFGGETIFWAAQGNTVIANPPHAVAYALISSCLLLTYIYIRERKARYLILAFIIGSVMSGFKVASGFVFVVGVGVAALIDYLKTRKKELFAFAFVTGLSNFAALKFMSRGLESFLIWQPWWFVRTTITAPGRVEWIDLELRRQHYLSKHTLKATLRVIQLETEAFLIFLIGNLGTRFVGIFSVFQHGLGKVKTFFGDTFNMLLVSSFMAGLVVVLLFIQKGVVYNLIEFFQYSILIAGFYAAAVVTKTFRMISGKYLRATLFVVLIALSIPTVIGNLLEFYGPGRQPPSMITPAEIQALTYLKNNSNVDSVVLTYPFNMYIKQKYQSQPWPISVWADTAYVSAISSRRTFLANENQVDILGIDFSQRHKDIQKYFGGKDPDFNKEFLATNGINYVYIYKKNMEDLLDLDALNLTKYYENGEVIIYKVL